MVKFANAPCSWGAIEGTGAGGVSYSDILDQMSSAGYEGSELGIWGFMPTDPAELKAVFSSRNMQVAGSWVFSDMQEHAEVAKLTEDILVTAELMAKAGDGSAVVVYGANHFRYPERYLNSGRLTPADSFKHNQWQPYVDGLHASAERVKRETGLKCALHPHGGTWIETAEEIATLMSLTDPALLGLCIDTGHFTLGGADLARMFELYIDRIQHVHLKDFSAATYQQAKRNKWSYNEAIDNNLFCNIGAGEVDFKAVLGALHSSGYDGWLVIEQDIGPNTDANPEQDAIDNLKYIKSIWEAL